MLIKKAVQEFLPQFSGYLGSDHEWEFGTKDTFPSLEVGGSTSDSLLEEVDLPQLFLVCLKLV